MPPRRCPSAAVALLTACIGGAAAHGDEIRLDHGGRLTAEVIRDADTPRSQLAVQSPWGRVTLNRSGVSRVLPLSPAEAEYRRRAPTVSDTADAQFALARWCRDNGLSDELRVHLRRVLDFEPDHAEARQLLGYRRVDGQWVTRDDLLASRGLLRHDGEYRTRQEIALARQAEQTEQARREWTDRLRAWRRDLTDRDPETARVAEQRFTELDAPEAVAPLIELLSDEANPAITLLLIDAAARLNNAAALRALADIALNHTDAESRSAALEKLAASGRNGLTAPFVKALRSKNNDRVNLAGDALASLADDRALAPLIEALTTTHRTRVGNDSGGDTYSFNNATGQFAFGGGGPKVLSREVRNPRVHRALVEMTGVNFLYDKQRWRAWLADREVATAIDLRRDS